MYLEKLTVNGKWTVLYSAFLVFLTTQSTFTPMSYSPIHTHSNSAFSTHCTWEHLDMQTGEAGSNHQRTVAHQQEGW